MEQKMLKDKVKSAPKENEKISEQEKEKFSEKEEIEEEDVKKRIAEVEEISKGIAELEEEEKTIVDEEKRIVEDKNTNNMDERHPELQQMGQVEDMDIDINDDTIDIHDIGDSVVDDVDEIQSVDYPKPRRRIRRNVGYEKFENQSDIDKNEQNNPTMSAIRRSDTGERYDPAKDKPSKYPGIRKKQFEVLDKICKVFISDLNSDKDLRKWNYRTDFTNILMWLRQHKVTELAHSLWVAFGKYVLRNFEKLWVWNINKSSETKYLSGSKTYVFRLIQAICQRFNVCIFFFFY